MITTKLQQAAETVNVWVSIGQGQDGYEWQHKMLTQTSDHDAADALATWWAIHPANQ